MSAASSHTTATSSASTPPRPATRREILAPDGLPVGSSFSFTHSFAGFHHQLWQRLAARLPEHLARLPRPELAQHLVFAVEASCNLWANLAQATCTATATGSYW